MKLPLRTNFMPEGCCEDRQYTNLQSEIIIYMMIINAKKYFFPERHFGFRNFLTKKWTIFIFCHYSRAEAKLTIV